MQLLTLILAGGLVTDVAEARTPDPQYQDVAYSCSDTTVQTISSRLTDGDGRPIPNMGSQIVFANGISLVDYETPKVVELERAGDKVQVCLVAVPKNCPPGDERGKVYRVFDYRQKAAYEMGDSQHVCGGA